MSVTPDRRAPAPAPGSACAPAPGIQRALACAAMLGLAGAARAQVVLRGGQAIDAPVVEVSDAGVTLAPPGAPKRVLSWAKVREVQGEHAPEGEARRDLADRCWRALARLERGDLALAEPLLEDLSSRGLTGPTGEDIALGLLRCRLSRGATTAAIPVWLDALGYASDPEASPGKAKAAAPAPGSVNTPKPSGAQPAPPPAQPQGASGETILDPGSGLVPALSPIWLDTPATRAFAASPLRTGENASADALGALYRFAAAAQCGILGKGAAPSSPPDISRELAERPGVALVRAIVFAQFGDAEQRARARAELSANIDKDAGTWREAWKRAALGRSLLREESLADRRAGALELLRIPARFGGAQPYLTGVALAEACAELEREGDGAAAVLRAELETELPDHPALAWLRSQSGGGAR